MWSDKVKYSTAAGVYCTTHDVKVTFCMPEFSGSKVINHRFRVGNDKFESGVGYDMILGHYLMVQLGLTAYFKRRVLQLDGATVHMKDPGILVGQSHLTKCKMREVVMQTKKPASTREATEIMIKSSTLPMQRQTLIR